MKFISPPRHGTLHSVCSPIRIRMVARVQSTLLIRKNWIWMHTELKKTAISRIPASLLGFFFCAALLLGVRLRFPFCMLRKEGGESSWSSSTGDGGSAGPGSFNNFNLFSQYLHTRQGIGSTYLPTSRKDLLSVEFYNCIFVIVVYILIRAFKRQKFKNLIHMLISATTVTELQTYASHSGQSYQLIQGWGCEWVKDVGFRDVYGKLVEILREMF
jgi:hypothetical protein